jgi:hypothetical protein
MPSRAVMVAAVPARATAVVDAGDVIEDLSYRCVLWLLSPRLCRFGGRGWSRLLRAGKVGAPDPDRGDVNGQGEQRDHGGNQEPAAEPGG